MMSMNMGSRSIVKSLYIQFSHKAEVSCTDSKGPSDKVTITMADVEMRGTDGGKLRTCSSLQFRSN